MDWIQTIGIIGVFSGFFIYTLSKLDNQGKGLREDIAKQGKELKEDIANQGKELKEDIHKLDKKISRIEDRLEFSNKVVYVQHEDLKEN